MIYAAQYFLAENFVCIEISWEGNPDVSVVLILG